MESKQQIMRRIKVVYGLRTAKPMAIKLAFCACFFTYVMSLISLHNIITNMPDIAHLTEAMSFILRAFTHTDLGVKFGIVAVVTVGIFMIRDAIAYVRRLREFDAAVFAQ